MSTPAEPDRAVVPFTLPGWDQRLHGFHCGDEVDVFALITQRYLIFLDTSATPEQMSAVVAALQPERAGRQPLVILTHADYDHAWGNAVFAPVASDGASGGALPAPIIGHALTRERLRSAEAAEELARRLAEQPRFASVRLIAPDIAYTERLVIDGGDLTLELLHTPGHTPDHTVVWIPSLRLLLAGDAVERPWPYVHSADDLPTLRATLARLAALGAERIAVCHGGVSDPALIAANRAYFDLLEERCHAALARTPTLAAQAGDLPGEELEAATIPYAEALQQAGVSSDEAQSWSYDAFHHAALRATLGWLAQSGG
ncbi:MAG TPA: MBL fold metallo-hydrolase [Ktedonobacterales bacterium]|jgi:glyoxylase-like metal-dependent hydrolase (beta-lactamase superfamily II)|nr:MBL fold metallo-hydrolase [Ktedonobacterales bacterium]HEX5569813.1 MBL fold metallo-hydrolase [Ktedonobacterales bacterium]